MPVSLSEPVDKVTIEYIVRNLQFQESKALSVEKEYIIRRNAELKNDGVYGFKYMDTVYSLINTYTGNAIPNSYPNLHPILIDEFSQYLRRVQTLKFDRETLVAYFICFLVHCPTMNLLLDMFPDSIHPELCRDRIPDDYVRKMKPWFAFSGSAARNQQIQFEQIIEPIIFKYASMKYLT